MFFCFLHFFCLKLVGCCSYFDVKMAEISENGLKRNVTPIIILELESFHWKVHEVSAHPVKSDSTWFANNVVSFRNSGMISESKIGQSENVTQLLL